MHNKEKAQKGGKKLIGTIRVIAKPMGFFTPEGSEKQDRDQDIVIFEEGLNCALDRDTVEIELIGKDRERRKGRVIKIIERNKTQFVGTLEKQGASYTFTPDDWKFYKKVDVLVVPTGVSSGIKALVEVEWNNPELNPRGKIIQIIGEKGLHETEMQSILLDKGIVYDFPPDVEREAEEIEAQFQKESSSFASASTDGSRKPHSEDSFLNRRDFRNITTFTIDPVDAKDFDDALSYQDIDDKTIEVGVHIADVSYFVRPRTALDREAKNRQFSVYLVDRTIPMLPEVLSNGLCSLNPNVDRMAFGAVFEIERVSGKVLNRWFGKTIINSDKRFSYEEAQEVLDSPLPSGGVGGGLFFKELSNLNRIANIYRAENTQNGAIGFETDEVKFELDSEGKPVKIYKKARLDTMKMIEEWMLLANREVAKFISEKLEKKGGASIFRIHSLPKMERIEDLAIFVRALGHELPIRNGEVTAKDINLLLQQIEGHASESLIKTAAIRSMAKAVYSTQNIGHFGLAFEYYTHFTSPIRRYADLMIHRILDKHLKNQPISRDEFAEYQKICDMATEKEISAAEAERESIKYKQVEFMQSKVGTELDTVISGVTEWGMYVEDPETKSEGLVRLKDMTDDLYSLDEKNYAIVGSRSKKKFSLGDTIRVKLVSADLDRKTLDFKLV